MLHIMSLGVQEEDYHMVQRVEYCTSCDKGFKGRIIHMVQRVKRCTSFKKRFKGRINPYLSMNNAPVICNHSPYGARGIAGI